MSLAQFLAIRRRFQGIRERKANHISVVREVDCQWYGMVQKRAISKVRLL